MKVVSVLLVPLVALAAAQGPETAKAVMKDAQGKVVGEVTLTETPHGVLIHAVLSGLPPGAHAFHLHTTGTCEPPFTSAGGHFNPATMQHGLLNPMGMHAGDMPNVQVPADGSVTFDVLNPAVTLKPGLNSVFKEGGTAIVIHGGPDDYRTDPAGSAGPRIACGVITH